MGLQFNRPITAISGHNCGTLPINQQKARPTPGRQGTVTDPTRGKPHSPLDGSHIHSLLFLGRSVEPFSSLGSMELWIYYRCMVTYGTLWL